MKYTVTAWIDDNRKFETKVNVRSDACNKTVFVKCMNAIGFELIKAKAIPDHTRYQYTLPNIWTNGYLGSAWFCDPFINIAIQEETGAWLALQKSDRY